VLPAFEEGLTDYVKAQPHLMPDKQQVATSFKIGLEGSFGSNLVTPRNLSSSFLKQLVCLEGIVTRCSLVRPKVVISRHWCEATGKQYSRQYHDATSLTAPPTVSNYPTHDENGNILSTEYGLSVYKDHQMICIQEMPERAPAGQLPVSVDVLLDNDLVDSVKPGDRLHAIGVYRPIPGRGAFYRTVMIANHIRLINREEAATTMTAHDIKMIKTCAKDPLIFEKIAKSIAPSIYGHVEIKKSILLMLLGGREHNLANGTHLRG
jgi:DNA replication licensing factor MCM3